MALMGLVSGWAEARSIDLKAFVVDHRLRDESTEEARAVSAYIQSKFNVACSILTLSGIDKTSTKLEELARNGRRELLSKACRNEGFEHLLLGHHLNDQIELFIMRLLAGSSWWGLSGMLPLAPMNMSYRKGAYPLQLVRPFLQVPKRDLVKYCEANDVRWWEDPTNQDVLLTERNLIRRLYEVGMAPNGFSEGEVAELLQYFGAQRQDCCRIAGSVLKQLDINHELDANELWKTTKVVFRKEIEDLPPAIMNELLFRILAPLSPKSDSTILGKRGSVREVMAAKSSNFLGVSVKKSRGNVWRFRREPPRSSEYKNLEIFRATDVWSEYQVVDNRWFFRWRLAKHSKQPGPRFFSVSFLKDPDSVFQPLSKLMQTQDVETVRRFVNTHPFLMWSNSDDPYTITPENIIGFPTLGIAANGLEVEVEPKQCAF